MAAKIEPLVFCAVLAIALPGTARAVDQDLARFATAKENQIREYAQALTNRVPPIVWKFFDAVRADDWETATNLAGRIDQASGRYTNSTTDEAISPALRTVIWPPIQEMIGAYEQFHEWNNKRLHRFGSEIIDSMPDDSIYFGGTDPGRFIISALVESQPGRKRIFVLTQNQMADYTYLEYLSKRYGKALYIPTLEDLQTCFSEYVTDAQKRLQEGRLKPGEDVRVVDGRIRIGGAVSVMQVNGLLVRKAFDKNPGHEFYIEESFPLDWMYPYLSPHGLIFQLHHEPLVALSATDVGKNQAFWAKFTGELIGHWITDKTTINEICDFVDKAYLGKRLAGFKGDAGFIKNDQSQKTFSKLRSAQAGMYAWRAEHARDNDERNQMRRAADLAFMQSYALCPYSPEAIFRYTDFLIEYKRPDDACLIVKASLRLNPDDRQLQQLMESVRKQIQ